MHSARHQRTCTAPWLVDVHIYVRVHATQVLDWLLRHGANATAHTEQGETPLHTAAFSGHFELMWRLHEAGAPLNGTNENGGSVLMSAVFHENEAEVARLIANGLDADHSNERGDTPLSVAASKGNVAIMRQLLRHGAVCKARGRRGDTPLMRAARFRQTEAARLLLEEQVCTCHEHALHTQCARNAHAVPMLCAHAIHMLCTCYAARRGGRAQPARRYCTHRGGARGQGGAAPRCRTALPHRTPAIAPSPSTKREPASIFALALARLFAHEPPTPGRRARLRPRPRPRVGGASRAVAAARRHSRARQ